MHPSSFFVSPHHQGEAPEIAIPIVIEVPVVAVEALAVPLQIQAIAVGIHGYYVLKMFLATAN